MTNARHTIQCPFRGCHFTHALLVSLDKLEYACLKCWLDEYQEMVIDIVLHFAVRHGFPAGKTFRFVCDALDYEHLTSERLTDNMVVFRRSRLFEMEMRAVPRERAFMVLITLLNKP